MTLVEEGRASLNDRLDKYIPAFADLQVCTKANPEKTVKAKRPILLKYLLIHTSGIDYPVDLGEKPKGSQQVGYAKLQQAARSGSIRTLKDFVEELAKLPLSCHPGYKYNYSFSYDVLGRVIEVISGKSLEKCLYERVFRPLGMKDTVWSVPQSKLKRLAPLYAGPKTWKKMFGRTGKKMITNGKAGLCQIDAGGKNSTWRKGRECKVQSGGGFMGYDSGGLLSTVADTGRWVKMLMNHGVMENGKRLLKKSTVEAMEVNRLEKKYNGTDRVCYLGNVGVFRDGANEYGMGGAACTYWNMDRKDGTATVWFTQHVEMPEFADLKGVDPDKADLWKLLHNAKRAPKKASGAKRKRSSIASRRKGEGKSKVIKESSPLSPSKRARTAGA